MTNTKEHFDLWSSSWKHYDDSDNLTSCWRPTNLKPQDELEDFPTTFDFKESLFNDLPIWSNSSFVDINSSTNAFAALNQETNGNNVTPISIAWNSKQVETVWSQTSTNKTVDWSMSSKNTWQNKIQNSTKPSNPSSDQNSLPIPDQVPTNLSPKNVFHNLWSENRLSTLTDGPISMKSQSTWNTEPNISAIDLKSNIADTETTALATGSTETLNNQPTKPKSQLQDETAPTHATELTWGVSQEDLGGSQTQTSANTEEDGSETDSLFLKLINAQEGWGVGHVDQSTPWTEIIESSVVSPGGSVLDEQQTTQSLTTFPVPSTSVLLQESNVWINEPPTGTGIWEMHYEQQGKKTARWKHQQGLISGQDPRESACPTPGSILSVTSSRLPPIAVAPNLFHSPSNESMPWLFSNRPAYYSWGSSTGCQDGLSSSSRQHQTPPDTASIIAAAAKGTTTINQMNNTPCHPVSSSNLRPLLGGSRLNSPPMEPDKIYSNVHVSPQDDQLWMKGKGTWNNMAPAYDDDYTSPDEWGGAGSTFSVFGEDDDKHGSDTTVHPYSHTYRADLVKHFMQLGYKKEDVQTVLIDCNMDFERSLAQLRQQYLPVRAPLQPHPFVRGISGSFGDASNNSRFIGGDQPSFDAVQFAVAPHSQQQRLIKQQAQQVRNFPDRTQLPVFVGRSISASQFQQPHQSVALRGQQIRGVGEGNGGMPNACLQPSTKGSPLFGATNNSLHNGGGINTKLMGPPTSPLKPDGFPPFRVSLLGLPPPSQFRTQRQWVIYNVIQELQKKQKDIINQMQLYRNNPALCSQPQCAAVFSELQGQLQHIESQLREKEVQLNLASSTDPSMFGSDAMGFSMDQHPQINNNNHFRHHSPNHFASSYINNNQDTLSQKFHEMRLRNGQSNNQLMNGFRGNKGMRFQPKSNNDVYGQSTSGQWMLLRQQSASPQDCNLLETVQSSLAVRGGLTYLQPVADNQRGNSVTTAALARFSTMNEAMEAVQLLNNQPIAISLLSDREAHALLINYNEAI